MSAAYSFWCSRCKISHAGECPPGVAPASKSHVITVGSWWVIQKKIPPSDAWVSSEGLIFEVLHIDPQSTIKVRNVMDRTTYDFRMDIWKPDGVKVAGHSIVRLVPVPDMKISP